MVDDTITNKCEKALKFLEVGCSKTGEEAVKMWKEEGKIGLTNYPESELIVLLLPKHKTDDEKRKDQLIIIN